MTGRQVHRLLSDNFSLWTVQEALKALTTLGLVSTETIGRAGVHTINEEHYAIEQLRRLMSPIEALTETVRQAVGDVRAVILFGSVGRGEARPDSDVDLAVLTDGDWDNRAQLQDAVRARLGNDCDVLAFTSAEFSQRAAEGEPVGSVILAEGVPLLGSLPRIQRVAL